jgi:hypothetical protein
MPLDIAIKNIARQFNLEMSLEKDEEEVLKKRNIIS